MYLVPVLLVSGRQLLGSTGKRRNQRVIPVPVSTRRNDPMDKLRAGAGKLSITHFQLVQLSYAIAQAGTNGFPDRA